MSAKTVRASLRVADKATQILRAAREEFLQHGYGATSMDNVALAANVSKATLYVYFANKRELFASIIREERDRFTASMFSGDSGSEDIQTKLTRFGRNLVDFLMAPETTASYRMVMAEAGRLPDLGEAFYLNGPCKLLDRLADLLASAMKAGTLRESDPRRAAEQLFGLLRGDLQLRALLGISEGLSQVHRDAVIRSGVDTFYRAYAP